ncbi:MetQ/NlpA family ABC transporter substrate-binding protein [Campylobacter hyointestinalis]|uniref:MetQ/NlpA family ABC transporter substrate-binding protein n=1 Tax=Campylobacter hyointestinalis TaxID=198 RepID=UPI000CE54B48|nr:MetQ/NlpA family ABC transporter substrate-binding protein [Campylobacter hyointestinalis]PPB73245.1 methionine ABC transporter substrate-binding protein [Campylobacter hyointestinalis subsp. hyointestinalis]PPB75949.1 methionine ABC transporter substrate-binding protein [Campylobacter hyointestinalis subsp. hyointestinalis]PPB76141.1 methionine ABC transporter substrate-binding protein [Campylobacter hyointestinalis subsp. hyointestinalis]PPB76401.1 methionine ABC transporter substrate-bind
MKKTVAMALLATSFISAAFAEVIKVGATPIPHAEILEFIKPELKKEGYELEIKVFNDYVVPNLAVEDGDLDANYFQHIPYLNEFNANKSTHLVKTAGVHLEPMGIYSKKIKSLKDLKDGATISIPNDPTNESRALDVLVNAKLIEVDNSAKLRTPLDITKNSKNLKFKELEAATLPRTLDDVDIAVINTNFAMNANLNPTKDALALESKDSPYVNIVVVKEGNQNSKKIKALDAALNTKAVKDFIADKYKGAIIPAF